MLSSVIVFSCRHRNGTIKERIIIHERRISPIGLLTVIAKKTLGQNWTTNSGAVVVAGF